MENSFLLKIFLIGKDIVFIFHVNTARSRSTGTLSDDDIKRMLLFTGPVEPQGTCSTSRIFIY